jgi:hypothetical protein
VIELPAREIGGLTVGTPMERYYGRENSGGVATVPLPLSPVAARRAIEATRAFALLEPNWDSYDAATISPIAIQAAADLIDLIARRLGAFGAVAAPFAVIPIADGGIQIEWKGAISSIEVEIGPNARLSCLVVEDSAGGPRFEELPDASESEVRRRIARTILPQNGY